MMTLPKVAEEIGVSSETLARAVRLGNLPADKIGNAWVTTLDAAIQWKEKYYNPRMKRH